MPDILIPSTTPTGSAPKPSKDRPETAAADIAAFGALIASFLSAPAEIVPPGTQPETGPEEPKSPDLPDMSGEIPDDPLDVWIQQAWAALDTPRKAGSAENSTRTPVAAPAPPVDIAAAAASPATVPLAGPPVPGPIRSEPDSAGTTPPAPVASPAKTIPASLPSAGAAHVADTILPDAATPPATPLAGPAPDTADPAASSSARTMPAPDGTLAAAIPAPAILETPAPPAGQVPSTASAIAGPSAIPVPPTPAAPLPGGTRTPRVEKIEMSDKATDDSTAPDARASPRPTPDAVPPAAAAFRAGRDEPMPALSLTGSPQGQAEPDAPKIDLTALAATAPAAPDPGPIRTDAPVPLTSLREDMGQRVREMTAKAETVAASVRNADGGLTTEMELAPAELGRLHIKLETGDRGLMLSVTVERPESLDAVRRHLEGLHRLLMADGLVLNAVDIGTEGRQRGHDLEGGAQTRRHDPSGGAPDDAADLDPEAPSPPIPASRGTGRLDIRV